MEADDIANHYAAVAKHYQGVVYSNPSDREYQHEVSELCRKYLDLQPHHLLVDLAGGTGALGASIASMAKLTNPVLCVDPSREMLEVAGKKEGVTSMCMSAEEWSAKEGKVDRVVIRGALHHFARKLVPEIFSGIFAKLTPGGRLVVEKPADSYACLPYPKRVVSLMNSQEPQKEDVLKLLTEAGFKTESHRHKFLVEKPKLELFESFRARLCSGFSMFSDSEIEEGIREVDLRFPGPVVTYTDCRDFVVAIKDDL